MATAGANCSAILVVLRLPVHVASGLATNRGHARAALLARRRVPLRLDSDATRAGCILAGAVLVTALTEILRGVCIRAHTTSVV